jgi:hypothetical protein
VLFLVLFALNVMIIAFSCKLARRAKSAKIHTAVTSGTAFSTTKSRRTFILW